jgi:alcohol dehydrogenase class IV
VDQVFTQDPFVETVTAHVGPLAKVVVQSEPGLALARQAQEETAVIPWTQVLALGGGSTIDLAKALLAHRIFGTSHRVGYGPLREMPDLWPSESALPFIAVPTMAGTGSETSRYYLLSDPETHQKLVSRAWGLCPTTALLDPHFMAAMPEALRIMGAFDTFTHLWETYFCAQEGAAPVRALGQEGLALILRRMIELERNGSLEVNGVGDLQMASAWGGMALSNVRTGLLHTTGEALSAQCPLAHPLTLWVFFRESLRLFQEVYQARGAQLFSLLSLVLDCSPGEAMDCIAALWERAFARIGCEEELRRSLARHAVDTAGIETLVTQDRVLLTKEAPRALSDPEVRAFVDRALEAWT